MDKNKRVEQLKRKFRQQMPEVTEVDRRGAKKLLDQHKEFEESKDRSIRNEQQGLAKDVGSWLYMQLHGAGCGFRGYGTGKIKGLKCYFCGEHCSVNWTNAADGKWYGEDHVQFAGLNKKQQKRELTCLSSKAHKT